MNELVYVLQKADTPSTDWYADSVWFTNKEAAMHAKNNKLEFGTRGIGWRVIGVKSKAQLLKILSVTERKPLNYVIEQLDLQDEKRGVKKMDAPVITKTKEDKTVKVYYDQDYSVTDRGGFGEILYTSTKYVLGDKATSAEAIRQIEKCKEFISLPVYAYIHGGVALSTTPFNCRFDSGQSGIVYISRERVRQTYSVKRIGKKTLEKVYKALRADVEECSKILGGEVYGFKLEDKDGNEIDSCWGFVTSADTLADDVLEGRI